MQKIKLKTEESRKKLLEAYAPPKWSETADDDTTPFISRQSNVTKFCDQTRIDVFHIVA